MKGPLSGLKVAILVADGFEQVEMTSPREALERAGTGTDLVSPARERVRGLNRGAEGDAFDVDMPLEQALVDDYDALVLPGGKQGADALRRDPKGAQFVRGFFENGKPVAAICHGPAVLAAAGVLSRRRVTSSHDIQDELRNAGAEWVDEPVVHDDGLVTSRKPEDLPAFNGMMIEVFGQYCPLPAGAGE